MKKQHYGITTNHNITLDLNNHTVVNSISNYGGNLTIKNGTLGSSSLISNGSLITNIRWYNIYRKCYIIVKRRRGWLDIQ